MKAAIVIALLLAEVFVYCTQDFRYRGLSRILADPKAVFMSDEKAKYHVLSENYVYVDEEIHLQRIIEQDFKQQNVCRFALSPISIAKNNLGFAFPKHSPFLNTFRSQYVQH